MPAVAIIGAGWQRPQKQPHENSLPLHIRSCCCSFTRRRCCCTAGGRRFASAAAAEGAARQHPLKQPSQTDLRWLCHRNFDHHHAGAATPLEGADPSQPRLPRGRPGSIPMSSYDEDLPSDAEVVPLTPRRIEEVSSASEGGRWAPGPWAHIHVVLLCNPNRLFHQL